MTKKQKKVSKMKSSEIIDELYPLGKRIELFARTSAAGWDTWGNEI